MPPSTPETLQGTIERLLPNGLGAQGDEERDPVRYPTRPLHVLLACSGSVASVKIPLIVRGLLEVCSYEPIPQEVVES
jgi:phosphopantothenoylcysteine decarboxylase